MKNNDFYYLSENCCFDRKNHRLIDANHETKHQLTGLQYKVLNILVSNRNNILEYDQIIENVWDSTDSAYQRNLADIIYQLRKIDDTLEACINTHRNLGFSLRCDFPQPPNDFSDKIHIVPSGRLEEFGYTPLSAAQKLMQNDFELFGDLGKNENQGEAQLWASFIEAYPNTFYCAFGNDNELVGNWSFCIPKNEQLSLIKKGQVKEACFNFENMDYVISPDPNFSYYDGFILNFSLNRPYRTSENERLLFDSFANQLLEWAKEGIFFQNIYVNVFIADQEQMYKNMGFAHKCSNTPHGDIYCLNMVDLQWKGHWARHPQLKNTYRDYFLNNKNAQRYVKTE